VPGFLGDEDQNAVVESHSMLVRDMSPCGAWVVVQGKLFKTIIIIKERLGAISPVSDCGKEFAFYPGETQVFEQTISLFERRHFYRSEWGVSLTSFL